MDDFPLAKMPGHLIRRLHQHSSTVFLERLRLKGYDLTPVQFAALDTLHLWPGMDQATLAKAISYDRATIGGVVKRLQAKGLITRKLSEKDRRSFCLWLSQKGIATLAEIKPIVADLQSGIVPNLSDQERVIFLTLAEKVLGQSDD